MSAQSATGELVERILSGDARALARGATFVESRSVRGRELISGIFAKTGSAEIIGITGPPGAGKSTLVNQLIKVLRTRGKTVGVIAVDPSSPFSNGAILGDRIRMGDHYADAGVFIRSMATRGRLGGVAQSTLEMALLLDAAGRDYVLIETVGVGQDEIEIARLADVTVLVLVPGLGDDVQAMKAGVMESADVFVINKADLPGAARLEDEIRAMQSFGGDRARAKAAPLKRVVATTGEGVEELLRVVNSLGEGSGVASLAAKRGLVNTGQQSPSPAQCVAGRLLRRTRKEVWLLRLREMLQEKLLAAIPMDVLEEHAARVAAKMEDPYAAVDALIAEHLRR